MLRIAAVQRSRPLSDVQTLTPSGPIPAALLIVCYGEMRRIARRMLMNDGVANVLQPTELANEATIRLLRARLPRINDGGHLLAIAARTMRQVIIDEARKRLAGKRQVLTLWPDANGDDPVDIEALHRGLAELSQILPGHAEIVELRFMLGLSMAETVSVMGISERTVTRHWQAARLWLLDYLRDDADA